MFNQRIISGMIGVLIRTSEIDVDRWHIGFSSSNGLPDDKEFAAYFDAGNLGIARAVVEFITHTYQTVQDRHEGGNGDDQVRYVILYVE